VMFSSQWRANHMNSCYPLWTLSISRTCKIPTDNELFLLWGQCPCGAFDTCNSHNCVSMCFSVWSDFLMIIWSDYLKWHKRLILKVYAREKSILAT
jgi:hypothetical protein